jgi:aldose 1-epimerase
MKEEIHTKIRKKFNLLIWTLILVIPVFSYSKSLKKIDSKKMKKEVIKKMKIKKEHFGKTNDGEEVDLFTLTNKNGITLKITNYGGIITSIIVPDKNGKFDDIVLGFNTIDKYLKNHPYFGAIIGRYANRISKAKFLLNGNKYKLAANNGENHLHGGIKGFDKVLWKAEEIKKDKEIGVKLSYLSKHGEEGYPGNLSIIVTYLLTNNDELKIKYEAETDKTTPVNLTNHSYFNLKGAGKSDILSHVLTIHANKYTPVDKGLIPTGELKKVKNTPMDFLKPCSIGLRIKEVKGGYDHNFVLNQTKGILSLAARAFEPETGRTMEILTTQPGIQFYSGNFLDGTIKGKNGKQYNKHYGFCLETQHFPDSPNHPKFPSTILKPGEKYIHTTIYKFYTQ